MCLVFSDMNQAESFNAYIYGSKRARMSGQNNAQIGHVGRMEPTKFVAGEDRMRVQHIKRDVTATVDSINVGQGYGHVKVDGERLFFHSSQLIGCVIEELNARDTLSFDIVFNPRTNKFLAKNVRFVGAAERANSQIGHFQNMQAATFTSAAVEPTSNIIQQTCQGRVTKVHADYGFVETAEQETIFFHYTQIIGAHMSELAVGDVLTFSVVFNKVSNRKIAENVRRCHVRKNVRENTQIGHFQSMQVATLTSHAVENAVVQLEQACQGRITKVHADYGFAETAQQETIFFHYTQLIGTHMSELAVGDMLIFNVTFNKTSNRKVAQDVRMAQQQPKPEPVRLVAAKNLLQVESAKLLRRLSQNLVINVQDMDTETNPEAIMKQVAAAATTGDKLSPFANLSNANSRRNSRRGSTCSLVR